MSTGTPRRLAPGFTFVHPDDSTMADQQAAGDDDVRQIVVDLHQQFSDAKAEDSKRFEQLAQDQQVMMATLQQMLNQFGGLMANNPAAAATAAGNNQQDPQPVQADPVPPAGAGSSGRKRISVTDIEKI